MIPEGEGRYRKVVTHERKGVSGVSGEVGQHGKEIPRPRENEKGIVWGVLVL